MKIINFKNSILIFSLISFAALTSCNEEPTPLGYSLVKDTVEMFAINSNEVTIIYKEETSYFPLNFINPGISLVGEANGIKAGVAIRFGPIPDTLNYLTANDIVECELTLHPHRYALGDTINTNFLSFGVHENDKRWVVETTPDEFMNGSFYKNEPFASFSSNLTRKDTMDAIKLPFSKSLVIDWFKKQAAKTDTIWGISLVPKSDSKLINQFYGSGANSRLAPYIRVIFNNSRTSKVDTLFLESALEKNFSKSSIPLENDRLTVYGGLAYRPKIYFDVTSIPKFAGIHKAELTLTLDKSKSFSANALLDTVVRFEYYRSETDEKAGKTPTLYYFGTRTTGSDKLKVSSITSAVSYWNRLDGKGSFVMTFDNSLSQYRLNKLSFHTSQDPDTSKRPKLVVIYSVLKLKDN